MEFEIELCTEHMGSDMEIATHTGHCYSKWSVKFEIELYTESVHSSVSNLTDHNVLHDGLHYRVYGNWTRQLGHYFHTPDKNYHT